MCNPYARLLHANSQGVEKKSSSATAAAGGAEPPTEGRNLGAGTGGAVAAAAAAGDAMVAGFLREEGPGPVVDGVEAVPVPVPVPVAGLLSGDIPKLAKGSSSTGREQQRGATAGA